MGKFQEKAPYYHNKTRIRVCGLLEKNNHILLLKHDRIGKSGYLWSPPGGGISFQESAEHAIVREFEEETNLAVEVQEFLFVNEYQDQQLHAIELFFRVKALSDDLRLGSDPELLDSEQILLEAKYWSFDDIENNADKKTFHNCFSIVDHPKNVFKLKGYHRFENI